MRIHSIAAKAKIQIGNLCKGFTLIEFIVIAILIGIIGSVALARWDIKINAAAVAEELASQIRYTQMLAMTHAENYVISFNTTNNTYMISTAAGVSVLSPLTGNATVSLNPSVRITDIKYLPNNSITFDGLGIPYTDSSATTALTNTALISITADSQTFVISVYPTAGGVTVQ